MRPSPLLALCLSFVCLLCACGEDQLQSAGPDEPGEDGEVTECTGPVDADGDGAFVACGPFTVDQPDCDDTDVDNWSACAACVDADGDEAYVGCDAYGGREKDCDDANPAVQDCSTCVDKDGDGYFAGCPPTEEDPTDCDDADPDNWASCATCKDADKDTFFVGCDLYTKREGPDCNDGNPKASEIISGVCGGPAPTPPPKPRVVRLRVATFNTLFRGFDHKYPNHTWKSRVPSVRSYLRTTDYDLYGFQEVWGDTLQYVNIRNALPATHAITSAAAFIRRNAIAYRKSRFALEAQGHFKLPGEASKYATWARFRELASGRRLLVLNAHLSAHEAVARANAARKIVSTLAGLNPGRLPVLLIGDFNSATTAAGAPAAIFRSAGYLDAKGLATTKANATYNSHHGFRANPPKDSRCIDKVLVRGGTAQAKANLSRTDVQKPLGEYSSDHFPVMADVTLTF